MMLTALSLLPPLLIFLGGLCYARAKHFDGVTQALLALAFALYYFHFYYTNWQEFTIDPQPHMEYVRFLIEQHRLPLPTDNMGAAARHPPSFYIAAAFMLQLAEQLGLSEPEQFVRHLAMACYAVFILAGAGLLRQLVGSTPRAYYASLLILLFWPIGVTIGGRISCDVLLFAGQAGCLYAMTRWQAERNPTRLAAPFVWAGIAALGKNSGFFMIGFALYALTRTAWAERRNWRTLVLRRDLILAIFFACTCTALSFWHGWILRHIEPYGYYWENLWHMLDHFNPFLFLYDTGLGLSQDSFWNMWLHTLLLGDATMRWNYPTIVMVEKILFLSLLAYAMEGLIAAHKTLTPTEKSALQMLITFIALMIFAALYLLLRTANPNYADARYAYPAMLIFALIHGIAMKHHFLTGRMSAYHIGSYLSISFACVTVALFMTQYLG